ncbi:MAG: MoxR family ATPase [Gemmatimonadota bacterium]
MEASAAPRIEDDKDVDLLGKLGESRRSLEHEIGRRVVGQADIVEGLLTAILADGHALLVGVPGLAKTLLVSTLAQALDLKFSRIQFTPDLMPADITGTEVLEEDRSTGKRVFRFMQGPIFGNIVLADEINRAPPKTQAALLQAMQERSVTAGNETFRLSPPFFVLATQNPIEQEGTYPLPEAQLDRFMFELRIGYPTREEEERIAMETTGAPAEPIHPVMTGAELCDLQGLVRRVPAPPSLVQYAVRLVRSTRPEEADTPELTRSLVSWGAGPRASQYLVLGAKARAAMDGRGVPNLEDVRAVAPSVLRHRVVPNFEAEAEGRDAESIVDELIERSRSWT